MLKTFESMKMPKARRYKVINVVDLKVGDVLVRSGYQRNIKPGVKIWIEKLRTNPAALGVYWKIEGWDYGWMPERKTLTEEDFVDALVVEQPLIKDPYRMICRVMRGNDFEYMIFHKNREVLIFNENYETERRVLRRWKRETGWYEKKKERRRQRREKRKTKAL